jgi:hypothetical protein
MPAAALLQRLSRLAPLRQLSLSEEGLQDGYGDLFLLGPGQGQPCGMLLPELLSSLVLPCALMAPEAGLLQVRAHWGCW